MALKDELMKGRGLSADPGPATFALGQGFREWAGRGEAMLLPRSQDGRLLISFRKFL